MKFIDFLNEGNLAPSIDDNDVLTRLNDSGIVYTRTKLDNGQLNYAFDNRYSLRYDGTLFKLYRHENLIHYMNARNKKEIDEALKLWNDSYHLYDVDLTDEDVDDIMADLEKKSGDEPDDAENTEENEEDNKDDETEEDQEEDKQK